MYESALARSHRSLSFRLTLSFMNPIILSGMHRSGTSAVTRLVRALGLHVGSDLLGAAGGNVYGHFEEAAFIQFHDRLIARLFPIRAPFCEWLPLAQGDIAYTAAERAEARSIWEAHHAAGGDAWKDPRTSLFLDLWTDVLPGAKIIVCLRHPYQVHRSLLRRGEPFLHVDYGAGILGWTIYNERILHFFSTLPRDRCVVVDADAAFRQPRALAEKLALFLDLPVKEEALGAIDSGEFHFEAESDHALDAFWKFFPEAEAMYRQLRQFDLLEPVVLEPTTNDAPPAPGSAELRLIEFEEAHGLRAEAKKLLIRSIAVDRKRTQDHYKRLSALDAEKDGLIDDLARLNEHLKRRIAELESARS
jgi:hypothetical protein